MQSKQWKHPGSPPPKKFNRVLSAGKVMTSIFWDSYGVIMIDSLSLAWPHDKRCILCRQFEVAMPGNHKKEVRKSDSPCSAFAGQRPCPHKLP